MMSMSTPTTKLHESKRFVNNDKMSVDELTQWMNTNGFSAKELGELLGVTTQAVKKWTGGERDVSVTTSRLIRMFIKFPQLIKEF